MPKTSKAYEYICGMFRTMNTTNQVYMRSKLLLLTLCFSFNYSLFGQSLSDLSFGTDSTFEVMTWNIEWFPKHNNTVDSVKVIIEALAIDVIAVQEIDDEFEFENMMDELDGWDGFSLQSDYLEAAYIYNTSSVAVDSIYEILTDDFRELPRSPLVMELTSNEEEYIIVNLHLKCCGDGYINTADLWDEEVRRRDAVLLLDDYISTIWPDEKVILLGDLNDLIDEPENNNVFMPFINDSASYLFLDMEIAMGDEDGWSYPGWPSHIDHIMITNELFENFELESSYIELIEIEDNMAGGFSDYEYYISDHRPLAIKITSIDPVSSVETRAIQISSLQVYPNPALNNFTIDLSNVNNEGTLDIYTSSGVLVESRSVSVGHPRVDIDASHYQSGVYFIRYSTSDQQAVERLIIQKD